MYCVNMFSNYDVILAVYDLLISENPVSYLENWNGHENWSDSKT